jgi:hypothetical protein
MPFPPTFDEAWDITQPPDTQPANQLGLDIRNLKNDIMQRMSLLSGILANRPTPETVNATWGGSGFGIIYIATDTSQVFQWNGTSWTDITSSFVGSGGGLSTTLIDFSVVDAANTSSNVTGNSITVPSGKVAAGTVIEIVANFKGISGASNGYALYANGTSIVGETDAFAINAAIITSRVFVASTTQIIHTSYVLVYGPSANGVYVSTGTVPINFSASNTFNTTINPGPTGELQATGMIVRIYT